jgi:uncharacterized membrane protein
MSWYPWLLWLHIFGAIVAFGPLYTFPLIARLGARQPMYANFATRVSAAISHGITIPLAVVQGITGVALLLVTGRDLTFQGNYWLDVAIVLYLIALTFSYFVQARRVGQIIDMTAAPPPPAPAEGAPAGPPPALLALIRQVQRGGMALTALITVIIFLMVVKPGS